MARNVTIAMTGVALALCTVAAQADVAPLQAYAAAGWNIPAAFSMLLWAPLLGLGFACAGGLLWLIRADAQKSVRKAYRGARQSLLPAPKKSMPV